VFPVRTVWTIALHNQLTAPPVYDASHAFFPIQGDRLAAYSIPAGELAWIADSVRPLFRPCVGDGLIFIAEQDGIVARRTEDGSRAWTATLSSAVAAPLVWEHGWLVAVTTDATIVTFRATDGAELWRRDLGSPAHAAPTVAVDRVYVPTNDHRIVALRIDTGEPVWERRLGGEGNAIVVVDDRLYTGSQDNFLYCLMVKDGRVDWRWRTGGDVIGDPIIDDHRIYFVSLDNVLRSLNRISGVQQWMKPLTVRPSWGPVKVVDRLVIGGQSSTLQAYALKDGATAGTLDGGAEVAAPPHLIEAPDEPAPMLLVTTRDLAKGAVARLFTRRIEPDATQLSDPLPNVISMAPKTTTTTR